jgi:hypothetical protein
VQEFLLTTLSEHPPVQVKTNPIRAIAAVSILAIGVCILAFAMTANNAANRDFVCYWAAGQQLVHHENPYDGAAILRLQQSVGFTDNRPFFMRNPPSAFFLALPLGFVGVRTGVIFWSLAIIAALMGSVRMLWLMHGRPPDRLHLVGYIFPPALACLLAGQIGIFILLGIVLFLYFHKSLPYFAGAALLLCALKPHLFLPFAIVLLAWILSHRAYQVLAGACSATLASLALSLFLDPSGWSHYTQMVNAANLKDEFIPTLSLMLRLAVHRNFLWLQFVLEAAASLWALRYFQKRRNQWNWMEHGSILLLVSVMVAPYAWFTDEAVLLPAVLAGLYRASSYGRSLLPFGCVAGVALIEVLAGGFSLNSGFYLWTAPAWFAWYLYAVRAPASQLSVPGQFRRAT